MYQISHYLISAIAVLIILALHEYAHGYIAYKLGDPTAKNLGRLTLNPIKHIDPFGALCMIFFRFGWAKPVPINLRYFKKPKRDFALTALAGPLMNLLCAFFGGFLYLLFHALVKDMAITSSFLQNIVYYTSFFLAVFHQTNLGLAIFNLIPIPPLDGSRLLSVILPSKAYYTLLKHERTIYWGIIGWLFLGSFVSDFLLAIPAVSNNAFLNVIANILSLSGLIEKAIIILSDLILRFWQLIPFLKI